MKEYKYKINGNTYRVSVGDIIDNVAQVDVNGTPYRVELDQQKAAPVTVARSNRPAPAPRTASGEKVITKAAPASTGGYAVKAPLPGVILSVGCKVGDTVKASDTVVMLEAMKMENAIHAGRDGKVAAINVNPGDSVLEGVVLITLE